MAAKKQKIIFMPNSGCPIKIQFDNITKNNKFKINLNPEASTYSYP